jgi:hypothetical protein
LITVRIPLPSGVLWTNLLGLFGLAAIVLAVGALTDWRWAMLTAGLIAVGLAALAQAGQPAEATAPGRGS